MALATRDVCDTKIAGIGKSHELGTLMIEQGITSNGIRRSAPHLGIAWLNVGALLGEVVRVSTMAVGATDRDRVGWMHAAHVGVALNTGSAFGIRLLLRLPI